MFSHDLQLLVIQMISHDIPEKQLSRSLVPSASCPIEFIRVSIGSTGAAGAADAYFAGSTTREVYDQGRG